MPDWVRRMNPENAEKHMFHDGSGLDSIGAEAFSHMLSQSGASLHYVSPKYYVPSFSVWFLFIITVEHCVAISQ